MFIEDLKLDPEQVAHFLKRVAMHTPGGGGNINLVEAIGDVAMLRNGRTNNVEKLSYVADALDDIARFATAMAELVRDPNFVAYNADVLTKVKS